MKKCLLCLLVLLFVFITVACRSGFLASPDSDVVVSDTQENSPSSEALQFTSSIPLSSEEAQSMANEEEFWKLLRTLEPPLSEEKISRTADASSLPLPFYYNTNMTLGSAWSIDLKLTSECLLDGVNLNRSVPMAIFDSPSGTVSYALIMLSLDSPIECNWLVANIKMTDIPENASVTLKDEIIQGINSFGKIGYSGENLRKDSLNCCGYVYALDTELNLENGFTKEDLLAEMQGHYLGFAFF